MTANDPQPAPPAAWTEAALREATRGREIYIWGASDKGYTLRRFLEKIGLEPAAFLDRDPGLHHSSRAGRPILPPEEALKRPAGTIFIFAATVRYNQEIAADCQARGLVSGRDFLSLDQLSPFSYAVDVSGACNLKCVFCARIQGGFEPPAGFMSPADYRLVLDKIRRESPLTQGVTLFISGEPFLHPRLPEIIDYTNQQGLASFLAANLSFDLDFGPIIAARPTYLRIGLSGTGPAYELAHAGGDWNLVRSNLYKLRDYQARYHPGLTVEIYYLMFKHNQGPELDQARALAEELGFAFREIRPDPGGPEVMLDLLNGRLKEPDPALDQTRELLMLPLEEGLSLARAYRDQPCSMANHISLSWDLKLYDCQLFLRRLREGPPAPNYLETPLEEILARRDERERGLCRDCRAHGLHHLHTVYDQWRPPARPARG